MNKLLPSQKNTTTIDNLVKRAARSVLKDHRKLETFFEHGHWWVSCRSCGAQWDAVDAEGGKSVYGFDFEEITQPMEDSPCSI